MGQAKPGDYESAMMAILKEDKYYLSMEYCVEVFVQWCQNKPNDCFSSSQELIDLLTDDQSDVIVEEIGHKCLPALGDRILPEIASNFPQKNGTQSIYLLLALQLMLSAEALETLKRVAIQDGEIVIKTF